MTFETPCISLYSSCNHVASNRHKTILFFHHSVVSFMNPCCFHFFYRYQYKALDGRQYQSTFTLENEIVVRRSCKLPKLVDEAVVLPRRIEYEAEDTVYVDCSTLRKTGGFGTGRCNGNGEFEDLPTQCIGTFYILSLFDSLIFKHIIFILAHIHYSYFISFQESVKCDAPAAPKESQMSPRRDSFSVGESVTFECNFGFKMIGNDTAVCGRDGNFTLVTATCQGKLYYTIILNLFHAFNILQIVNASNSRNFKPRPEVQSP